MAIIEKKVLDGKNVLIRQKEVPDMYVKGKGVRFRGNIRSVRITDTFDELNILTRVDSNYFIKLIRLCLSNHWATQTLTKKYGGRGYTRGMTIQDVAEAINLSSDKACKLLRWAKEKDYIRRDTFGNLVVNPLKIQMGNRISASEYYTYRDLLEPYISTKYRAILFHEYKELERDYKASHDEPSITKAEWKDVEDY